MQKEALLLSILQEQDDWMTTATLANLCNVSTRTIRTYVANINTEQQFILSSTAGYRFNHAIAQLHVSSRQPTLESAKERARYIVQKLLQENRELNRYDLCDEMYISTSTLKNDLGKVKEELNEYDLYLHQKGDLLWCDGMEKNRRRMVSAMIYQESNARFMNDELIKTAFSHIPVLVIKERLQEIFHRFHYFTNDYSFSNLLLHLCISADRIQNCCSIATDYQAMEEHTVEYEIAWQVSKMLEETCDCKIEQDEMNEIALLIISRSSYVDPSNVTKKGFGSIVSEQEHAFVQSILRNVNDTYYINLNNDHFITRFTLHIHNLFIRTHTRYLAKNDLTREMKMSFPLIYDIAVYIANMIEEYTGTKINDDEIAYIALHIGSSLDETTNESNKIHTVVLCPQYYDLNHHLIQKIKHHFQHDLLITQLITREEELDHVSCQLLLSTYRPHIKQVPPCIIVHPLLTQKDIDAIDRFIREQKSNLKNYMLKQHLLEIFPEELFLCDQDFIERDEALCCMSNLLQKKGIVNEAFYKEIIEREAVSSTAFDHFAIPHSLKMDAHKTCVCTSLHHRSIQWDHHQVNFIFMIAVNHLERKIFKDIFSSLTDILIDPNKLSQLLKADSYASFIEILSSLL